MCAAERDHVKANTEKVSTSLELVGAAIKDPSVQAALQHVHVAKDRAAAAHEHQQQAQQQAEDAKQQAEQKRQAVTAATTAVAAVGAAIAVVAAIPVLGEIAEAALVPAEAAAVAAEAAAEAAVVAATEVVATAAEVAADVGAEVAAADIAVEAAADGLAEAIEAADALPTAALEEAGEPGTWLFLAPSNMHLRRVYLYITHKTEQQLSLALEITCMSCAPAAAQPSCLVNVLLNLGCWGRTLLLVCLTNVSAGPPAN